MTLVPNIKLNNGFLMPIIGLGTFDVLSAEGESAVKHAIDVGYRHFDTAFKYKNEQEIGRAIKLKIDEGIVERKDIFLVTKLWSIHNDPQHVERACRKSLKNLGFEYIDLYLMHTPAGLAYLNDETHLPMDENGKFLHNNDIDYLDTWRAMENLVKIGLVRSIGISNFNSEQIERLLRNCEIRPVVNEIECHPQMNQKRLREFCTERNIAITAYCPLGQPLPAERTPFFFFDSKLFEIAKKYQKSVAQIILKYLIQIGTAVIPKSTVFNEIDENINIFDFVLSSEDTEIIEKYNTGIRTVTLDMIKGHKYYPFDIDF